ncbi:MAG: XRE family transcriptional regulator [Fibrobacterales bacterium]
MKYNFGDKIRKVRQEKKLTMKELARMVSISESMVSQIERNLVSPAIDTLLTLADVLDVDFEYLFGEFRNKKKAHVVRADARHQMLKNGVRYEQLSNIGDSDLSFDIGSYYIEIEVGSSRGARDHGHVGNELGVIVEGRARFEYGTEIYELGKGDSISFSASVPHVLMNDGDETLKAIWVVTPPKMIFNGQPPAK